jgi:hypothetical protein
VQPTGCGNKGSVQSAAFSLLRRLHASTAAVLNPLQPKNLDRFPSTVEQRNQLTNLSRNLEHPSSGVFHRVLPPLPQKRGWAVIPDARHVEQQKMVHTCFHNASAGFKSPDLRRHATRL